LKEEFDNHRLSKSEAYLGSRPSTDGRWESWAEQTGASPYPIEYTVKEVEHQTI
jgi:hypothetical protein